MFQALRVGLFPALQCVNNLALRVIIKLQNKLSTHVHTEYRRKGTAYFVLTTYIVSNEVTAGASSVCKNCHPLSGPTTQDSCGLRHGY